MDEPITKEAILAWLRKRQAAYAKIAAMNDYTRYGPFYRGKANAMKEAADAIEKGTLGDLT